MIAPSTTHVVTQSWDGRPLDPCDWYTITKQPRPRAGSDAFRAHDLRFDHAEAKRQSRFYGGFQQIRTWDWAFGQTGAIVTSDRTIATFA